MENAVRIPAKATSPSEQSDAVVVSFEPQWHTLLPKLRPRAIIRKRVPKTLTPTWLYFHINSPVSALCARARIKAVSEIPLKQALSIKDQIGLSPDDITAYFGAQTTIGCYQIGDVEPAKTEVSATKLNEGLVYHPPQSFFVLSHRAKEVIDSLAGFAALKASKKAKK